ncbi:hypothetical protein H0E87_000548 [Populus deltoides]|uniref:Uncharacterized protein n=1 Tax=Populus deltoides TaxID=3696 RepID=A0A8T2ZN30_POPDE|nr:hypothetical protein H0E87_000548 [Populus deltoides]
MAECDIGVFRLCWCPGHEIEDIDLVSFGWNSNENRQSVCRGKDTTTSEAKISRRELGSGEDCPRLEQRVFGMTQWGRWGIRKIGKIGVEEFGGGNRGSGRADDKSDDRRSLDLTRSSGGMCVWRGRLACENMPMRDQGVWGAIIGGSGGFLYGEEVGEHGIMGAPCCRKLEAFILVTSIIL